MNPFFSILVPTRNRARLLQHSLQTAIIQEFEDYEIIISDNNSTDDTKTVVDNLMKSSDKISYVNPGRDLSMCANWEFVLSHARGSYVMLLCDDDALAPTSLSYIHELLTHFRMKVLVWRYGSYHYADFPDENLRLTFSHNYNTGDLFEIESKQIIDALFRFDWRFNGIAPKMLNCAISRTTLETCRERTGSFFFPPYPDFSTTGQLLGTNTSYHFIDLPLYISGASRQSNAAFHYERKRIFDDYVSLYQQDLLAGVPYQMRYLCTSYFYAAWLSFKRIYPEAYTGAIDTGDYLKALFQELMTLENYEDVSEESELLSRYMREFSGSTDMFERLCQTHRQTKTAKSTEDDQTGRLPHLKRTVWNVLAKSERAYRLFAQARGHNISGFSHKNVRSMGAAANILSQYLAKQARPVDELRPIKVHTPNCLLNLPNNEECRNS